MATPDGKSPGSARLKLPFVTVLFINKKLSIFQFFYAYVPHVFLIMLFRFQSLVLLTEYAL